MNLFPKVRRNSQSNLNSIYSNFFNKVKTFRTAAETIDCQTNYSYGGSEGGGDFQQTTGGGGGGFHNHTPNASYRGNPNDYVENNPNRFYQNEFQNSSYNNPHQNHHIGYQPQVQNMTPDNNSHYRGNSAPQGLNQSSFTENLQKPNGYHQPVMNVNYRQFQQNSNGYNEEYHPQAQNIDPDNNLRGLEQNLNGTHYREYSAQQGPPNESSYREELQKRNGFHQPVINVNYGQLQQKSNVYNKENDCWGFQENQNGLHSEMNNVHSQSSVNNVESENEVNYNGLLEKMDGFCNEGSVKEAMMVWNLLYKQGIDIGLPRYCQLMKVIGEVIAKQEAKLIHNHLRTTEMYVAVQNKVLEMHLKCGLISEARELFGKIPARNLTSWDTMIVGLAENGHGEEAIDVFTEFKKGGGRPDGQMFLGVLYACSTLCDINEGMLHFESMSKVYGIAPSMDHYVGVVKMLGSTGYLDEAFEFIENMPVKPSIEVWETLMNLCRIQGNLETGDLCADIVALFDLSRLSVESKTGLVPENPSDHVISEKKKKYLGQKSLGLQNRVQEYRAGDTSHTDSDKIHAHLKMLSALMKESGYLPELRCSLHDVDDESKAATLLTHSEKLACISGLLSSPARSQMRIIKNLRSCVDCHNAFKVISKIVGRRIISRDAKRFHHFEDGVCSCGEFW
ncbi:hypothetical protein MKW94_013860 [Papaver nudicaule]|uniref:DYW domain-containing protein n=1 Tax=Papaver nudicaule TaxID=74823 RepID=A0AA41VC60_PAPNU|nr:hypothetical protein [Papaver nudicaule]